MEERKGAMELLLAQLEESKARIEELRLAGETERASASEEREGLQREISSLESRASGLSAELQVLSLEKEEADSLSQARLQKIRDLESDLTDSAAALEQSTAALERSNAWACRLEDSCQVLQGELKGKEQELLRSGQAVAAAEKELRVAQDRSSEQ
ncbi:unnamed protein product, partial [Discosporangium mesarthrocarpum]